MASPSKVELLEARVAELESELSRLKGVVGGRGKIDRMSDEVVDSNPYRLASAPPITRGSYRLWLLACSVRRCLSRGSRVVHCLTSGSRVTSALPLQPTDGSEEDGHCRQLRGEWS